MYGVYIPSTQLSLFVVVKCSISSKCLLTGKPPLEEILGQYRVRFCVVCSMAAIFLSVQTDLKRTLSKFYIGWLPNLFLQIHPGFLLQQLSLLQEVDCNQGCCLWLTTESVCVTCTTNPITHTAQHMYSQHDFMHKYNTM